MNLDERIKLLDQTTEALQRINNADGFAPAGTNLEMSSGDGKWMPALLPIRDEAKALYYRLVPIESKSTEFSLDEVVQRHHMDIAELKSKLGLQRREIDAICDLRTTEIEQVDTKLAAINRCNRDLRDDLDKISKAMCGGGSEKSIDALWQCTNRLRSDLNEVVNRQQQSATIKNEKPAIHDQKTLITSFVNWMLKERFVISWAECRAPINNACASGVDGTFGDILQSLYFKSLVKS